MRLPENTLHTPVSPSIGGIEFAEDIVNQMDIDRAMRADPLTQPIRRGNPPNFTTMATMTMQWTVPRSPV